MQSDNTFVCFEEYGDHRELNVRTHSFPTRRCSDLSVPKACVYGFLGPNGSGKSTTIRMLCGLLTPTEGEIEVLGLRIPEQSEQLRSRIGHADRKSTRLNSSH